MQEKSRHFLNEFQAGHDRKLMLKRSGAIFRAPLTLMLQTKIAPLRECWRYIPRQRRNTRDVLIPPKAKLFDWI